VLEIAKLEQEAEEYSRTKQPNTAAWKMRRAQKLRNSSFSLGLDDHSDMATWASTIRREY
jgi:hypothetical protein